MSAGSKIESSEYSGLNKVVGWFLTLRWIACGGVFFSLIIIDFSFHFRLPYKILFTLNGILFLENAILTVYYTLIKGKNLSRKELRWYFNIQVCLDYILLLLMGYFTGFLENPILYYFVFHIMLTAFIFSNRVVFWYVGSLLVVLISVMFSEYYGIINHYPLYFANRQSYNDLILIRGAGLCTTLIISSYLITGIKNRIEERGKRVEVELNRYKSLDTIKSNFILQVTHEIRGPLAALKGFHEMILKGITGETGGKTIETIQKANRRTENLITMVDEMIDYAYMRAQEDVQYTKTEITLKDAIDTNLSLFSTMAMQKGIRFSSNCSGEISLIASPDLMNIILSNLISNAIKYSPPMTVITINAEKEQNVIHIMVSDEGIGITPEELNNIFEEFYRTRKAREIERDGTGLGLPIVHKAVESLNGKITVYSEQGKGTTFHIYIPEFSETITNIKKAGGNNEQRKNSHHR